MGEVVDGSLLLVAAAVCAATNIASRALRLSMQVGLVAGTGIAAVLTGSSWPEIILIVLLLALFAATVAALEAKVALMREEQLQAKRATARRTALLDAAGRIANLGVEDGAGEALRVLRKMGFDASAVVLVRDGRIQPVRIDDLLVLPETVSVDVGLAGRAVRTGRTVAVSNYDADPERLPDRPPFGTMICAPIRARDEVIGALVGTTLRAGTPTEAQIEVMEFIASHLGIVFDNRRQEENQRLLLERMDRLDAMRSAFVGQVSDELRDPLTVVRSAGHTLRVHSKGLAPQSRSVLIDRLCDQADDVRQIVDAILDFSRFQATRQGPGTDDITIEDLIVPFRDRIDVTAVGEEDPDLTLGVKVSADAELLRHAIATLLVDPGTRVTVSVVDEHVDLSIQGDLAGHGSLTGLLIEQLVVRAGASVHATSPTILRLSRRSTAVGVTP